MDTRAAQTDAGGPRNLWLGRGIAFGIVLLAGVNGVFTFSGARLFVDVWYYALLFAVAVQFAIAVSLIALPSVYGVGRLVLLLVYLAALSLSTASAYSFVYTAGTEGGLAEVRDLNASDRAAIGAALGEVLQSERRALDQRQGEVGQLARRVEEEASMGLRSGRGPGKGPEYYRKLETLETARQALALERERLGRLERSFDALAVELGAGVRDGGQRDRLLPLLSQLQSLTVTESARERLSGLLQNTLGSRPNPVEAALSSVIDRDEWSLSLLISLVWAGIFDLLALFLGIVRYYLLRPGESVLKAVHEWFASLWLFGLHMGRLPRHARQRLEAELERDGRNTPLNSIDMQNFATYLLAANQPGEDAEGDSGAAIGKLIRRIEPLDLPGAPDSVGIPYAAVEQEPALRNLLAFMIRHRVFSNDVEQQCYVLATGGDLAHKVLVMVKLGMNAESLEGARRLMLNTDAANH